MRCMAVGGWLRRGNRAELGNSKVERLTEKDNQTVPAHLILQFFLAIFRPYFKAPLRMMSNLSWGI
jgi:hypothetical protein